MHNVAQLRRLREHFPDTLVVIGVHSAKFPSEKLTENIQEAAQRHDIQHPIVNDAGFRVWKNYNVHAWPTVVLIDPDGKIVGSEAGEINADEYIPVIEDLVSQYEEQGLLNRDRVFAAGEIGATAPMRALHYPAKVLAEEERLYVADTGHHRILEVELDRVSAKARVVRVIGSGEAGFRDGNLEEAAFHNPRGMALLRNTLYVADTENHAVRAVDFESGRVRTVAGTGEKGFQRQVGDSPTEIPLRSPWDLLVLENASSEEEDVLLIAMAGSHQIWILVAEERLGIFAGNGREALVDGAPGDASFNQPMGLALGMGHLFVADAEASAIRAIALIAEPRVFTVVGTGLFDFGDEDGQGSEVRLQHPAGIVFQDGWLNIADSYNHKIKRMDPTTGTVETLIGTGEAGIADGEFEHALFYQPEGLDSLGDDMLVIADTNNHRLRIANLEDRKVVTVELLDLGRLGRRLRGDGKPVQLNPVTVGPGKFTLTFNLMLPAGMKLNEAATSTLTVLQDEGEWDTPAVYPIPDTGYVTVEMTADEDVEVALNLLVYYCEEEDERLCLIHEDDLIQPVVVRDGELDADRVELWIGGDSAA